MAWAFVGSAGSNGAGASLTVTYSPTAGNFVVCAVTWDAATSTTITSVKDSAGTSLTLLSTQSGGSGSLFETTGFYGYVAPSSITSFVLVGTPTTGNGSAMVVMEYSGLASPLAIDGTPGKVTQTTSPIAPAYTSSAANELTLSVFGDPGSNQNPGITGWTTDTHSQGSGQTNAVCYVARKNSTNGTDTASWTFTGTDPSSVVTLALKLPAAAGVTEPIIRTSTKRRPGEIIVKKGQPYTNPSYNLAPIIKTTSRRPPGKIQVLKAPAIGTITYQPPAIVKTFKRRPPGQGKLLKPPAIGTITPLPPVIVKPAGLKRLGRILLYKGPPGPITPITPLILRTTTKRPKGFIKLLYGAPPLSQGVKLILRTFTRRPSGVAKLYTPPAIGIITPTQPIVRTTTKRPKGVITYLRSTAPLGQKTPLTLLLYSISKRKPGVSKLLPPPSIGPITKQPPVIIKPAGLKRRGKIITVKGPPGPITSPPPIIVKPAGKKVRGFSALFKGPPGPITPNPPIIRSRSRIIPAIIKLLRSSLPPPPPPAQVQACIEVSDSPVYIATLTDSAEVVLVLDTPVYNVSLADTPVYQVVLRDTPVDNVTVSDKAC